MGLALLSTGCQQGGPLRLSVMPDTSTGPRFTEVKETPYVNPVWLDVDETPGALDSALSTTGSAFGVVFSPVVIVSDATVRFFTNDHPSTADKLLEDRSSADNRREGMNKLADFGFLDNQIFVKRCREIAARDVDYTVRATAIRTANRARDVKATPLFIKALTDPNEWVRLEAAKALVNIPDVNAAGPLVELLNNPAESRDVRVAAADALKHYRTLPVVRALSAVLSERNFVIAWQARRSLQYLTGRDFGYDVAAWLAYFSGNEKAAMPS
jgi:hypothetical protein